MNLRVPQNAENLITSRGTVNFSERSLLYGVSLFSRVADTAIGYCGIVIITMYCEEISGIDYFITYETDNGLIDYM